MQPHFHFTPRWKEELVCQCDLGTLVLELSMGSAYVVYLPPPEVWARRAPDWAKPHWQALHDDLKRWCAGQGYPLEITDNAQIY